MVLISQVAKRIRIFDGDLPAVSEVNGELNGLLSSPSLSSPAATLVALRGHLILSRGGRYMIS